jgi:hypothetical protein
VCCCWLAGGRGWEPSTTHCCKESERQREAGWQREASLSSPMGTLPPVHKAPARSDATPWVRTVDHDANRAFYPQMMRLAKEIGIDPKRCVCVCACACVCVCVTFPSPAQFLLPSSPVLMAGPGTATTSGSQRPRETQCMRSPSRRPGRGSSRSTRTFSRPHISPLCVSLRVSMGLSVSLSVSVSVSVAAAAAVSLSLSLSLALSLSLSLSLSLCVALCEVWP